MRYALAAAVSAVLLQPSPSLQPPAYDILITNGTILDGSGAGGRSADLAVKDGRIASIGRLRGATARETIDAKGLAVAPGFIDVHTHADAIARTPGAENFVRMGVTTVVAGNCGGSALDVGEALTNIRQIGSAINFATLIGHNTVRRAVMGNANREPTVAELARMKSLVWKAMADGAVGFSTGLEYVPGTYARTSEILELARVAANAGGLYASHMRDEGNALEAAIQETVGIGEQSMCRVEISHLKVDSPSRWGASGAALSIIDAARKRGIDVKADQYAYTAASSTLGIRFPSWVLEGDQDAVAARLTDPGSWETIKAEMRAQLGARGFPDLAFSVVASYTADPALNGLSIKQIAAAQLGSDSLDAQMETARQMMIHGGASMVYHLMSGEDVDRIMKHPQVGIASDSSVLTAGEGVPHPRGYGNTVRVLGEYVRKRHVLTLEEAVRKMTSLPAEHFRFARRGLLKEGYAADITIFNPATVGDAATFEKPHAYALGVPYVIVNGAVVVRNGEQTSARPGQVLQSPIPNR
jgi:N-acyl-D-amino-acid deacylase